MQLINTLTVLALVVMSFALIVAVPVLYASNDESGNSNKLILFGGLAWVALFGFLKSIHGLFHSYAV